MGPYLNVMCLVGPGKFCLPDDTTLKVHVMHVLVLTDDAGNGTVTSRLSCRPH